ncbi:MAG: hypothetical protein IJ689_04530 [Alphaproteobacteria bacterium]|nr:hypothetical protein [Alphaproteobacteria bacterium]
MKIALRSENLFHGVKNKTLNCFQPNYGWKVGEYKEYSALFRETVFSFQPPRGSKEPKGGFFIITLIKKGSL